MKAFTADYQSHLESGATKLCYCLKIVRTDGVELGLTSHDQDLEIDGLTYHAAYGYEPTATRSTADMSPDNVDIEGILGSVGIPRADIAAGLYDNARLYVFRTRWDQPAYGDDKMITGWWGEAELRDHSYRTTFVGLEQALRQNVGRKIGPQCDATLGDGRCKVDLGPITVAGTVTTGSGVSQFADASRAEADGYFDGGLVTWTTGENSGLSMEVETYAAGVFQLRLPMPDAIEAGDDYTVYPGCRKTPADCKTKFNNYINFQGFPDLPGADVAGKFGGQ